MTESQAFIEERTYRVDSFKRAFVDAVQASKLELPEFTYKWVPNDSGVVMVSESPTHRFEFVLDFALLEMRQSLKETLRMRDFVRPDSVHIYAGSILGSASRVCDRLTGVMLRAGFLFRDYGASTVQRALIDAANEVNTKFPSWDACPYT